MHNIPHRCSAPGSEHGSRKTLEELVAIAAGIDRPARQRTTMYGVVERTVLAAGSIKEGQE